MRDWLLSTWPFVQLVLGMLGLGALLGALVWYCGQINPWLRFG